MEDDAIVIATLGQFSEVLTCLIHARSFRGLRSAKSGIPTYSRGVVPVKFQLNIAHVCLKHDGLHGWQTDVTSGGELSVNGPESDERISRKQREAERVSES